MTFHHNFQEWLSRAKERYENCKKLLSAAKDDPSEEPYRSKYKAKDILCSLLQEVETKWIDSSDLQIILVWALLKYDIGLISLETEEYAEGCDDLTICWERIQGFSCDPKYCILSLNVLNQLGILWSNRNDSSKALIYLTVAEKLCQDYKSTCTNCPYTLDDVFESVISQDGWDTLEKTYTLTLYYLAQVYEHMKESAKSAEYCHMTLKRQRDYKAFDEKEWSINCATLSQYYIQEKNFETGRHLLACAEFTVAKYEASIDNKVEEDYIWDDIRRSKAEIAWCWAKYAINLLLECSDLNKDTEKEKYESKLVCRLTNEDDISEIENKIPFCISSYDEAKNVFRFGQNQIKEAQRYYSLDTHANNYIQLMQDKSKLFKYLIEYESDIKNQCKMHKRRIDILEDALSKLNPQYYLSVCRQLRFELGETYYELVDLKYKMLNSSSSTHLALKVNSLMVQCIDHFGKFVESLKNSGGVLPEVFSDDLLRPALIAHFYLGRLYFKLLESDVPKKLQNLSKCEEYYEFILKYSEKNPDHANTIENELPLVKEMLELIPEKRRQIIGSV